MKILLIEDEKALADSINSYLKQEGYLCETAKTVFEGDEKITLYQYDCVLVDLMLPDGSGMDVVKTLKKAQPQAGIIIISARHGLNDKINGLELGADDYLTKPFHLSELNARIKSLIRRKHFNGNREIVFHEIKILPEQKSVFIKEKKITLTKKEYQLLLYFVSNKSRNLSKESIAEHLWGDMMDMADSYDFIYTHIKNLRKKLIDAGSEDYIRTQYGMGYKFSDT